MPKNVAERLQKLEKEIQSVISIYDTANNTKQRIKPSNDKPIVVDTKSLFKRSPERSPVRKTTEIPSTKFLHDSLPKCPDGPKEAKVRVRDTSVNNPKVVHAVYKKPGSAPLSSTENWCLRCHKRIHGCDCRKSGSRQQNHDELCSSPHKNSVTESPTNNSDKPSNSEFIIRIERSRNEHSDKCSGIPTPKPRTANDSKSPSRREFHTDAVRPSTVQTVQRTRSRRMTCDRSPVREVKKRPIDSTKVIKRSTSLEKKESSKLSGGMRTARTGVDDVPVKTGSAEFQDCVNTIAIQTQNTEVENNKKRQADEATRKLREIIEKNHERVEKMRESKELALGIAKELKEKYDTVQTSKKELCDKIHHLEEANVKLQSDLKQITEDKLKLHNKLESLKKEFKTSGEHHESKIKEMTEENKKFHKKVEDLERHFKKEISQKDEEINHLQKTRFTLESTEVTQLVHKRVAEYKAMAESAEADNKTLRAEVSQLEMQCASSKENEKRVNEAATEMKSRNSKMEEDMTKLRSECAEQLQIAHDRLMKMEKLEEENKKKEDDIKKLQAELDSKGERLKENNKELESLRQKSQGMEQQVQTLRSSVENFDKMEQNRIQQAKDYEEKMGKSQKELNTIQGEKKKLAEELHELQDSLRIKSKIIEDQQETIKQLREKNEEAKTVLGKNKSLERIIEFEREEKLELQEMVEALQWRKQELKLKIKSLEDDLLLAPEEVVKDLKKTQYILRELENDVQVKQKEWEMHLLALMREKDQACSDAEFAKEKLMQRTKDFQRQTEELNELQRILTDNWGEKDRRLREVNEKMSNTRLKQIITALHSETKRTSRAMGRHHCGPHFTPDKFDLEECFSCERSYSPSYRGLRLVNECNYGLQHCKEAYREK